MNQYDLSFTGRRLGSGHRDGSFYIRVTGANEADAWLEIKKTYDITKKERCTIVPPPPTEEELSQRETDLLARLPEELRSRMSYMSYERGHNSGKASELDILSELVSDLEDDINKFGERRFQEGIKQGIAQTCRKF